MSNRIVGAIHTPLRERIDRAYWLMEEIPSEELDLGLFEFLADIGEGRRDKDEKGATYRSIAALAHKAGMDSEQKKGFFEIAGEIPLTQHMVSHIFARLQEIERAVEGRIQELG